MSLFAEDYFCKTTDKIRKNMKPLDFFLEKLYNRNAEAVGAEARCCTFGI
jgi:hypothetical protein